mmetsp:Transcript_28250/g.65338  ORF Transcript_28250/g.65338 Transcript_28250/m.65338 type:complete len:508 (+) Transcript_28250:70-1593(+)
MASIAPNLKRDCSRQTDDEVSFEDEDSMVDVDDPEELPDASQLKTRIYHGMEELQAAQSELVEDAVECTGVPSAEAALMLRAYGWDVPSFTEAYFENPNATRRKASVFAAQSEQAESAGALPTCSICFCESGCSVMPCERLAHGTTGQPHPRFCLDCWQQYLGTAIQTGKGCLDVKCPAPGCGESVRPDIVFRILGKGPLFSRYERFMIESLVDDSHGRRRWCPGQHCGRAADEPLDAREVSCYCGIVWCYSCSTDAHLPVSCEIVKKWEEKNRDEEGDATWIRVNTKPCPKCQNSIEKNGGCMHMTCRKPGGCGHEFCWICMGDWSKHSTCNAKPEAQSEVDVKARAKSELLRYAHFYERFMEHDRAQRFAAKEQMDNMEALANILCQVLSFKVADVLFLCAAVREVVASRRFLKWTYAYAFFATFTEAQRRLFEFHQAQLEGTLERLSDILENTDWNQYAAPETTSKSGLYNQRTQVLSLTNVVHDFFSKLQDAIQKGTLFSEAA